MTPGKTNSVWLPRCNLCGGWILHVYPGKFGRRCLSCTSTFIHRGIGAVLVELAVPTESRVYELASQGAHVRFLRRRYPNLTLSEYFYDVPAGSWHRGVQCQDVQKLTYGDGQFDLVTSTEVFEHVENDRRGFAEVARVLAPGGLFVFTVPLEDRAHTLERARVVNGRLEHLAPPEYHGDIRGLGRILAFRSYGRDVVERLEEAGFTAEIRSVLDPRHAIVPAATVIVARR